MENEKEGTRDRELIITRKLKAPVELVWEVWTQPEHIAQMVGAEWVYQHDYNHGYGSRRGLGARHARPRR